MCSRRGACSVCVCCCNRSSTLFYQTDVFCPPEENEAYVAIICMLDGTFVGLISPISEIFTARRYALASYVLGSPVSTGMSGMVPVSKRLKPHRAINAAR